GRSHGAGKAGPGGVERAPEVAVANAAPRRVLRIEAPRLAPGTLLPARPRSGVHLGVQTACGLMRDQMDRPPLRGRASEPLRRRDPSRVRRAVRVVEAGNRLGDDLDAPRRGLERMALRIAAEIFEQHEVAFGRRQFEEALGPELLEAGERDALGGGARAHLIVDPLAPGHLVAVFGERALVAETLRQRAENIEVVLRVADRVDGAVHGENE